MEYKKFKYKIVEKNDDYTKTVIEKSGPTSVEFSLDAVIKQQAEWTKEKKALEGQLIVEREKVANIEHHHPFIKEMSEEDQYTTWLYYQTRKGVVDMEKQVELRANALNEYQTEKEHIMEVLGFQKTNL